MSKTRKINAVIAAAIAAGLTALVALHWHRMGCDYVSLAMALAFYLPAIFALWYTVDGVMKENNI